MGALAPVASWSSEDDHLLKNAIETGMSFETLGKGAVQFSQKFTFQELKDRWHSLTSHASVFVEASPHIVESVDSSSTLSPETHILEYKVQKSVQRKRMNESVLDCYNPMLKRVKSSVVENGDDPRSTDHGEANQKHFESGVSNCESVQHMPNLETVSASAATAINVTESRNSIVASLHCDLHKFEEDSHSLAKEAVQPCGVSILKLNDACCCEAEIPVKSDQVSITYAESDFSSSKVPRSPIWNTSQSISEATLPEAFQVEVQERNAVDYADFSNDCDANNFEFLGYDIHSDPLDQIPCHNLENSAPGTDGHFARSASCLDLKNLEEFLFTDIDGKDIDNIPDLDSFLLDFSWGENLVNVEQSSLLGGGACPGDLVKEGKHLICSSGAPLPFIPAAHPELPTCVSDAHMLTSIPDADNPELHISCALEAQSSPTEPAASPELPVSCIPNTQILPSVPNVDPDLPGLCNGVICCVLNTEDTEIPCNDDALIKLSSQPLSRNKGQVRGPNTMNRAENKEQPRPPCESIQSQILSDLGINLPFIIRGE
ncbi:hypothetical protein POM88_046804 [Heracleum sosnowskyi]|uniref:Microspherule protein N-terminal domain-containing protein n=1 Tax=Heracleum sosnowskyi TaxID=360622 RepID=A0AAD8H7L3_9APIA|nr:hypothetical protein POM88_046804 [Heracleum sosnowskyi]